MSDQKRPYRKQRRAELEQQTRLKITESAMELHGTLGPSRTSVSAVAEHAGVRRSTVYRHFPDESALFAACSSHWLSLHSPPDPEAWAGIDDPQQRLGAALAELYGYYRVNESMLANLHRDETAMPIVEELFGIFRAYLSAVRDVLAAPRLARRSAQKRVEASIGHALAFTTWQSLTREQGLGDRQAADLMCRLVQVAATGSPERQAGRRTGRRTAVGETRGILPD